MISVPRMQLRSRDGRDARISICAYPIRRPWWIFDYLRRNPLVNERKPLRYNVVEEITTGIERAILREESRERVPFLRDSGATQVICFRDWIPCMLNEHHT